ncbi:uncharacterized protein V6R79_000279 [Siganus canaliculatus]
MRRLVGEEQDFVVDSVKCGKPAEVSEQRGASLHRYLHTKQLRFPHFTQATLDSPLQLLMRVVFLLDEILWREVGKSAARFKADHMMAPRVKHINWTRSIGALQMSRIHTRSNYEN